MPALTPEDRQALLGPRAVCISCRETRIRHYCRSCDAFFDACSCNAVDYAHHLEHRISWWTPKRIVAIPDFDALLEKR